MSEILCVTNRKLCNDDFLGCIEKIAEANPSGIILREKDLTENEYKTLAEKVLNICKPSAARVILHSYCDAARELGCRNLHMPLPLLRGMTDRSFFKTLGASCHSVSEAKEAEALGCSYIIAGHIFDTECKKGLPGRGLEFLKSVCESVSIPVYAIGGIGENNVSEVIKCGARGVCVMSGVMLGGDPRSLLYKLTEKM